MIGKIPLLLFFLFAPIATHANLQKAIESDHYQQIFFLLNEKLKQNVNNGSTLFLKAMYAKALNLKQAQKEMETLTMQQPAHGLCLQNLVNTVEQSIASPMPKQLDHSVIVTLGAPCDKSGQPGPELLNRLQKTHSLAKAHPYLPILVTGGSAHNSYIEAQVMKQWLIEHHVSPSRIIVENKARDTLDNAKNSLQLLPQDTRHIILVTHQFHMKRALLIFDAMMKKKKIHLSPAAVLDNVSLIKRNKRKILERVASYRDRARAMGYLHFNKGEVEVDIGKSC